jgi:hypothetical protein
MPKHKPIKTLAARKSASADHGPSVYSAPAEPRPIALKALVEPDETNPLGGATTDELAAVVTEDLGNDPNLDFSETAIAVESLARVITARMGNSQWMHDPKQLAIFIVSDRVRDLAAQLNATLEPIIDNGSRSLTGKLWAAAPNFASGYFVSFTATDSGGMFSEVKAKGIGNRPALVFDPTATDAEIRYYPNGLDDDARVQRFLIAKETFTLSALDSALNRFHEQSIITPEAALPDFNPWKNGKKYIPRERAEAFFQGALKWILDVAFSPRCRVGFEVRGTEGRCDLLLSSRHPTASNTWVSLASLELKVLRSFTSGGSRVSSPTRTKAIADGLLQAMAYKREHDARDGLLCCFDMRTPGHCDGTTCLNPIKARAKRNKIELRHYRLYGSSADLRADKYGRNSGAA